MPSTIVQIEEHQKERELLVERLERFCYYKKGELRVKMNRWDEVDGYKQSKLLYRILKTDSQIESLRIKLVNQSF